MARSSTLHRSLGEGRLAGDKKRPATSTSRSGPRTPVQLRFATNLTSEQYVSQQAWRNARLGCCPWHTEGGCGFKRNGTYGRVEPPGVRIATWYCPAARMTVSLLPDCLAAKLSGSLAKVEQVVDEIEGTAAVEAAAGKLRPDIELPGCLRWVRRRIRLVQAGLLALVLLQPELLGGEDARREPTLGAVREHLGVVEVLRALRAIGEVHLHEVPPPLGFGPWPYGRRPLGGCQQDDMGARAPPSVR